jgi:hypothetical protein
MKTQQQELIPNPDFMILTVFVDEVTQATERLRLDGFQVTSWDWLMGHGKYVLHASRILTSNVADN